MISFAPLFVLGLSSATVATASTAAIFNGLDPFKTQKSETRSLLGQRQYNVFQASQSLSSKRSIITLFDQHCLQASAVAEIDSVSLPTATWPVESSDEASDSRSQLCSFASFAGYLNELSLKAYSLPTSGVFTSGFGPRWSRHHSGIDIANHLGTAIQASRRGEVVYADYLGAYGLMIEIQHPDGFKTRYAHCNEILVQVGENVSRGDLIARMGNTGRSTGSHLHFEIRSPKNISLDPAPFLNGIRVNQQI